MRPGSGSRALIRARRSWHAWLEAQGIAAARFQRQAWEAYARGQSGIISAPTGSGKTLAALGGPVISALAQEEGAQANTGFRILWVTPLRALASDTRERITAPVRDLLPAWRMATRTGDASALDKRLSERGEARLLITTPESLAILLSHERSRSQFGNVQSVVVDEWHELLPSKRGVLLQLNLARLRALAPRMQVWGLSATIGNLDQALQVLVRERPREQMAVVRDTRPKPFHLHAILPPASTRLPWAGHLGLANLGQVAKLVLSTRSSIIFTNTRSQAELWFTALSSIWPESADTLAIHHSSLDQQVRQSVEDGLRNARLRCVVATSSLDLGVDFPAVDRVIQVGGARSVARMVQRAGRARHRPGEPVHIDGVATQAMDLCEFAATRALAQQQIYENRKPLVLCLDVLSQHVMSTALAGGFVGAELFGEAKTTAAFEHLSEKQWEDVLAFLMHGSDSLAAYPQYERLRRDDDGRYIPANAGVARRHRLGIGTIVTHGATRVQYLGGSRLGTVEETFIARLSPGDIFNFAGRSLRLVRIENNTAWVRRSATVGTHTPAWAGSLMPMSARVGERMQALLAQAAGKGGEAAFDSLPREMRYLLPLLSLQQQRSHVPGEHELLIERIGEDGSAVLAGTGGKRAMGFYLYPFAGRVVHEGLALLLATRLAQLQSNTFSWACNEIGFMLQPQLAVDESIVNWHALLCPDFLEDDLRAAVNFSELARKRFREIAQISGLVPARLPGSSLSNRHLQVSGGLLFDVLNKHDPQHVLLREARKEALDQELHLPTLRESLSRMAHLSHVYARSRKHSPFSFGLWAESFRGQLSNESWADRVKRLALQMEGDDESKRKTTAPSRRAR